MIQNSFNYNDIHALNDIRKLGNEDKEAALKVVAKQFESMFLKMMLKSMRDANKVFENPDFLGGNESQFYRQMLDEQMSLSLSEGKGMGLADSFYRQMHKEYVGEDVKLDKIVQNLDRTVPSNPHYKNRSGLVEDAPVDTPPSTSTVSPNSFLKPFQNIESGTAGSEELALAKSIVDKPTISDVNINLASVKIEKTNTVKAMDPESREQLKNLSTMSQVNSGQPSVLTQEKKNTFSSPLDFIRELLPIAKTVAGSLGVDPKAILAQGALETGWGKYIIHKGENNSHNLFGIKADTRWKGDKVNVSTLEYRNEIPKKEIASFRSYESYQQSLMDYLNFIKTSPRYQQAIKDGSSIEGYAKGLQNGGYATDPQYAQKIIRIANSSIMKESIKAVTTEKSK